MKTFLRIMLLTVVAVALLSSCSKEDPTTAEQEVLKHLNGSQYLRLETGDDGFVVNFTDGSSLTRAYSSTTLMSVTPNGYWLVNGKNTDIKAKYNKKNVIETPKVTVDSDGRWAIDGESTGVGIPGTSVEENSLNCVVAVPDAITFHFTNGSTYKSERYISDGERYILEARRMQRPVKILMCGNSWSLNAAQYLGEILYSMGIEAKISVAYFGGSTIERVWNSAQLEAKDFQLYLWTHTKRDWISSPSNTSISGALLSDDYDIITFQQMSKLAGSYNSISPYLQNLIDWVTWHQQAYGAPVPDTYLHVTWAYPEGSSALSSSAYGSEQAMYDAVMTTWAQLYSETHPQGVINSGTVMKQARQIAGISAIDTDDGSHAGVTGQVAMGYGFAETLLRTFFELYLVEGRHVTDEGVWSGELNYHTVAQSDAMKANAVQIVADQDKYFK